MEVGSADKRRDFTLRHSKFFERGASLRAATSAAFDRRLPENATELNKVVFYMGIRAVADFGSILVLAANGLGLSATALLRGLYERVVTATYLQLNPELVGSFIDFSPIQTYRTLTRLGRSYNVDDRERQKVDEVRQYRDDVAEQFRREPCSTCKKSPMPNWTTVDFVTMAQSIESLSGVLASAYDMPLARAHATPVSIASMLKVEDDGLVVRDDFSDEADRAFQLAHMLLLRALDLQVKHFADASVEAVVEKAAEDYLEIWRVPDPAA